MVHERAYMQGRLEELGRLRRRSAAIGTGSKGVGHSAEGLTRRASARDLPRVLALAAFAGHASLRAAPKSSSPIIWKTWPTTGCRISSAHRLHDRSDPRRSWSSCAKAEPQTWEPNSPPAMCPRSRPTCLSKSRRMAATKSGWKTTPAELVYQSLLSPTAPLARYRRKDAKYIKRKIGSAQWLIESIEQRRNTLTRVAQAIVDRRRTF